MTTYDLEILIRTKKVGDDPSPPPDSGLKWTELKSKVDLAKQSFEMAARTVKMAYDALKQGAELEAARGRFENLTRTINTTGDALLGKLREATKGMVSDAELISGASDIISLGLAKNEGDTVRLATAVSTLGLDMQQVILTFANNSKARLDSLGLSVEGVTQKAAELEAQGFVGDAFDEAVLIGLEQKMQLLGDASQTTAGKLAILESNWANLTNSMKEGLAAAVEPAVTLLVGLGEYGDQVDTIIDSNIAAAKSFDDLVEEGRKIAEVGDMYGGLGVAITGTEKEVIEGSRSTIEAMAAQADSFEQFSAGLDEAFGDSRMRSLFNVYLQQIGQSEQSFYEMSRALAEAERTTAGADEVMLRYANSTSQAAESAQDLAAGTAGADAALLQNYGNLQKVEQGWQDIADAQQLAADLALVDPFNAAAEPINELLSAQQALADSEGEWVTRTVSTAGQLTAVNAQLASDLSDDQAKAYREILRTVDEGSAEWLSAYNALQNDLTQSQRDALVAQQADLANQPDRLVDVYTGDSAAAEEAQARITAANEAIKQSYRETAAEALLAQSGVTQANLDLLVGIGYMTQEQADARLEFANTTDQIKILTASFKDTTLTTEEQTAALNALIEGTAQTAEQAINLATQQTAVNDALAAMPKAVVSTVTIRGLDDADTRIGDILRQLDALDGRSVSANVTVNTGEVPNLGEGGGGKQAPKKALGGNVSAGKLYQVGEGNRPELYMIPGNNGQIFSNAQSQALMGGQTINDNRQTVINVNTKEAAALALASAQVSKRTRFNRSMGV
jgi:hypothetical protein